MIKPTVGRKMWYRPAVTGDEALGKITGEPLDATVVAVWGDRMVNVAVLDANAVLWPRTSVTLVQDGDPKPEGRYVEWMPYQISQAGK